MSVEACQRLNSALRDLFKNAFGKDLDETLQRRERELWIIGIDSTKRQLTDVCGTIGEKVMAAVNSKGFFNNDAGFRADAHESLPTDGKKVDVFLLNTSHFTKPDTFVAPLIVHELAHYMDQLGEAAQPSDPDKGNAAALRIALKDNVRKHPSHTNNWSYHLVMATRNLVTNGHSDHKTIKEFLEAAIPHYDRNGSLSIRE